MHLTTGSPSGNRALQALAMLAFIASNPAMAEEKTITATINSFVEEQQNNRNDNDLGKNRVGTSSDLEMFVDVDDGEQIVGVRFNTIQVPSGANIRNAYITLIVDTDLDKTDADHADVAADITTELLANSGEFTEDLWALTTRREAAESTTSVEWQIPRATTGALQETPNIASLITDLVSLEKWSPRRNAPTFFFSRASGKGNRWFESRGVKLTVVYDVTTTTATTATTTTITTTRTADPAIAILQENLAALETKLAAVGDGAVSTEQLQAEVKLIQESLVAIQTRLDTDAKDFNAQMAALKQAQAADIIELKATLAEQALAFQAFVARPKVSPDSGNDGNGADGAPSVQSDGKNNLIMSAPGGSVSFESAKCDVADLCQLQREHKSLMDKFQD